MRRPSGLEDFLPLLFSTSMIHGNPIPPPSHALLLSFSLSLIFFDVPLFSGD